MVYFIKLFFFIIQNNQYKFKMVSKLRDVK